MIQTTNIILTYLQRILVKLQSVYVVWHRNLHFQWFLYGYQQFALPNEPKCPKNLPIRKYKDENEKPPAHICCFKYKDLNFVFDLKCNIFALICLSIVFSDSLFGSWQYILYRCVLFISKLTKIDVFKENVFSCRFDWQADKITAPESC